MAVHNAAWVGGVGSMPVMVRAERCAKTRYERDTDMSIAARREREQQGIVNVEDYEWLVGFHAERYRWATLQGALCFEDIMQAGRMGLMRAKSKFDATRGLKFETYARWWVLQTIQRLCTEMGRCVRIPPNEYWNQRAGKSSRKMPIEGKSLDRVIPGSNHGLTRKDLLVEEVSTEEQLLEADAQRERERVIAAMFEWLTPRSRDVLVSRSKGMTLEEIGKRYGITRERVRQIEMTAAECCRQSDAGRKYQDGL